MSSSENPTKSLSPSASGSCDYVIAPSILSANFAKLGEEVDAVLAAGADWVHFDVMDNHYVPNLTVGPMVCKALRQHGVTAPIDVHLMVDPVDRLVGDFAEAGASLITFHPDATRHLDRTVQLIRESGCQVGIALNPATSLTDLDYIAEQIDLLLLMSVNPGFGGQAFISYVERKVADARARLNSLNPKVRIEVDGGVTQHNIAALARAGADTFVAGSAIYGADDYQVAISGMREALAQRVR